MAMTMVVVVETKTDETTTTTPNTIGTGIDDEGNDYKLIHWDDKTFVKDGTYCW